MYGKISTCWLTINRACNLKCHWCYAKNAPIQDMQLQDAKSVIDFLPQIGVKDLVLIGGEPTIYKYLNDLLLEAKTCNISTGIVTNGVVLKNKEYLNRLIDSGVSHFGVSLKGYNRDSFCETTDCDCYTDVLTAITNLSKAGIPFSVSFVLTEDNICNIHLGIKDALNAGAKRIRLSFCYDFEVCRSDEHTSPNPHKLAALFQQYYPLMNDACNGNLGLFQSLPFCVFDQEFIDLLDRRNQLTSVCQVLQKSGLVIDTDLSIIPCNAMYDFKIGRFGSDFYNEETFEAFWSSQHISHFYDKLRALPDLACAMCESYANCGGGCVSNWFNYSFSELKELKKHSTFPV